MTSADSKQPLAATRLRLPFDQLSAADFERLCLWLVRREGFEDVEHLGEAGSEQGRDIVARRRGRRYAFQCKRVQRFTAADARGEIAKIRGLPASDQPEVFVFVVSKAVRAATRKLARETWGDDTTCRFWCGTELDERVKRHPEVLAEFFDAGKRSSEQGRSVDPHAGRQPARIFLSSTAEDLIEHRAAVARAIERLQQQSTRMESFGARPEVPLDECRRQARDADALVVCVAHRYGWVPDTDKGGDGKKSITWLEVAAAHDAGKPVFAFLVDPLAPWQGAKEQDRLVEAGTDEEALAILAAVRGLADFRSYLDNNFTRDTFSTPEDLASKVATSISRWLLERSATEPSTTAPATGVAEDPPPRADPEIAAYRAWALERFSGLHLIGVGVGEVKVRLEEVYVPLRIAHRAEIELEEHAGKRRGELAREVAANDVELEEIFATEFGGGRHAVIFGEPGAGKTTALRKLLHHCLTRGPKSLGLAEGTEAFFLPLRRLAAADLSEPLPVFLQRELAGELADGLAARLWRRGKLLLLLDGLDEIGEESRRKEVCSYLEWQLSGAEKRQVRGVVSCRYSGYGGGVQLGGRFLHLDVRPLDADQVRELVRLWFREVQPRIPDYTEAEARHQADDLIAALEGAGYSSQQLKVLVSSPLLLTLLCVVVLRGGVMPRHRVAFYDQCLRVLLGRWGKTTKGTEPLLDAETALSALRTLAWDLHASRRRDDLSRAELLNHLRKRLGRLDHGASPFRVLDWLYRETGVIDEYGPKRYGFMHLGLQEYLAAAHVASRGEELLDHLADDFGDRWWREVILLLVGLPGHQVFKPFMERVLGSGALLEHADLLSECLAEAPEVDIEPFLAVLADAADPARQAAVLRLLRGRCDEHLLERVRGLTASSHTDLSALARQAVEDCAQAAESAHSAGHDLVLVHVPADGEAAATLAAGLERRGLRLFETADWESDLERIVGDVRGVAVLASGADGWPWSRPDLAAGLEILDGAELPLIPVLLPGAADTPSLPESVSWTPWIDVRGGVGTAECGALERAALGPEDRAEAVSLGVADRPTRGETLREPLTGIELLWIPGGAFEMGGKGQYDGKPIHQVQLSPFWLGETPVTNRQYGVFLKQTRHDEPTYWRDRRFSDPDQPVVAVTWQDAVAFCDWLGEQLELVGTLPSEAQWEYAARGTDGREYPWGNEEPDLSRACFDSTSEGKLARVGAFPAGRGPFGTLDQAGNVWEWCLDAWNEKAYERRQKQVIVDPVVTEGEGGIRVLRGGGWYRPAVYLRAASRYRSPASARHSLIGFRVSAVPASS